MQQSLVFISKLESFGVPNCIHNFHCGRLDQSVECKIVAFDSEDISEAMKKDFPSRIGKIDRFSAMALSTSSSMIARALLAYHADKIGVFIGNMLGGWNFGEQELSNLHSRGLNRMSVYQATAWFPAAAQGEITIAHGLKGFSKTASGGLFAGLEAMSLACDAIRLKRVDAAIVGVVEGIEAELAASGFADFKAQSFGECSCFFLLSKDDLSEQTITCSVTQSQGYKGAFEIVRNGVRTNPFSYDPFYLAGQPFFELEAIRSSLQPTNTSILEVEGSGRQFSVQLKRR
jgi:hypothetical protein